MRSRLVASSVAAALALAGCANLTSNHKQGLAVVGGVGVVVGSMVLVDGWSCDEANWHNGSCEHDTAELRNGAAVTLAGGALLTWALLQLAGNDDPPAETTRTAAKSKK